MPDEMSSDRHEIYRKAVDLATHVAKRQTDPVDAIGQWLGVPVTWVQDSRYAFGKGMVTWFKKKDGNIKNINITTCKREPYDLSGDWALLHEVGHIVLKHAEPGVLKLGGPRASEEYHANLFGFAYIVALRIATPRTVFVYGSSILGDDMQPILPWDWKKFMEEVEIVKGMAFQVPLPTALDPPKADDGRK